MRLAILLALAVVMTGSRFPASNISIMSLWRMAPEPASIVKFKLVGGADIIATDRLPLSPSINVMDIPIEPPLQVLFFPLGTQGMILFDLKVWVDYERHTDKEGHVKYRVRGVYPIADEQENMNWGFRRN